MSVTNLTVLNQHGFNINVVNRAFYSSMTLHMCFDVRIGRYSLCCINLHLKISFKVVELIVNYGIRKGL